MKFVAYQIADISTAHVTESDMEAMSRMDFPGRLAELDPLEGNGAGPGVILSVGDRTTYEARLGGYRRCGMSDAFRSIMEELVKQGIPYVRFDRDGEYVDGAQEFDW